MTDPAPLPWMHPTLAAAAKALGVSVRTLEQWRIKGAPLPTAPPIDELALRLWHLAFATQSHGKARTLAPPAEPLAPYFSLITAAIAAETSEAAIAHRDPARRWLTIMELHKSLCLR